MKESYEVVREHKNGAWGHQIVRKGVRATGTKVYGDSKRAEAQEMADMLNAAASLALNDAADLCDEPYRTPDGWGVTSGDQRCAQLIRALCV